MSPAAVSTASVSDNETRQQLRAQGNETNLDLIRGHESKVTCAAVSGDGKFVVTGSTDKTIRRWEARSGAPIGDANRGHSADGTCVVVSGDGKVIVSGSWDRTVRCWDAESGAPIGEPFRGHESVGIYQRNSAVDRRTCSSNLA